MVASTGESKCYMDICSSEFLKTLDIHKVKLRHVQYSQTSQFWGPVMVVISPAMQMWWSIRLCLLVQGVFSPQFDMGFACVWPNRYILSFWGVRRRILELLLITSDMPMLSTECHTLSCCIFMSFDGS